MVDKQPNACYCYPNTFLNKKRKPNPTPRAVEGKGGEKMTGLILSVVVIFCFGVSWIIGGDPSPSSISPTVFLPTCVFLVCYYTVCFTGGTVARLIVSHSADKPKITEMLFPEMTGESRYILHQSWPVFILNEVLYIGMALFFALSLPPNFDIWLFAAGILALMAAYVMQKSYMAKARAKKDD